jgi:hypothetical protein
MGESDWAGKVRQVGGQIGKEKSDRWESQTGQKQSDGWEALITQVTNPSYRITLGTLKSLTPLKT